MLQIGQILLRPQRQTVACTQSLYQSLHFNLWQLLVIRYYGNCPSWSSIEYFGKSWNNPLGKKVHLLARVCSAAKRGGVLAPVGGRVLAVTSLKDDLFTALQQATADASRIYYDGMYLGRILGLIFFESESRKSPEVAARV